MESVTYPDGSAWTLVQSRTASTVNEISSIANTTGPAWAQPAYDAAGNMTTIPTPASALSWANLSVDQWANLTVDDWANLPVDATALTSYTAIYDAWNRLVKLADGSSTVQENAYDGRNYRVRSGKCLLAVGDNLGGFPSRSTAWRAGREILNWNVNGESAWRDGRRVA